MASHLPQPAPATGGTGAPDDDARPERTGGCLCEAVVYLVEGDLRPILHCHCVNCRRITGNHMAGSGCANSQLTVTDPAEQLRWYDLGYARYGFCGTCGSTLFWTSSDRPEHTVIAAGTLDDTTGLDLTGIWFAAEAQGHNHLSTDVPHFAENDD